ncbi:RloB family protein [Vibrio vulnificus]|uniref:RloB family protein n=1 Tax=Vibrio vulnificus TaxID=672 RepID=UPI0040588522
MGSDDVHHKRKAKAERELSRRKSKRSSYEKVLIVCEGEKTEPNYFNELVNHYKLNSANVAVDGNCGSSPKSVFERAKELAQIEERRGDAYDRVYCVFDKDSHSSYAQTLVNIDNYKSNSKFIAVTSVPCFEYWLLLHFQFSTKPYHSSGKSSIANQVIKDLKLFMAHYSKGDNAIFMQLLGQLEFAKQNAIRANRTANSNHTDNPTTLVHELVSYLQNLKSG